MPSLPTFEEIDHAYQVCRGLVHSLFSGPLANAIKVFCPVPADQKETETFIHTLHADGFYFVDPHQLTAIDEATLRTKAEALTRKAPDPAELTPGLEVVTAVPIEQAAVVPSIPVAAALQEVAEEGPEEPTETEAIGEEGTAELSEEAAAGEEEPVEPTVEAASGEEESVEPTVEATAGEEEPVEPTVEAASGEEEPVEAFEEAPAQTVAPEEIAALRTSATETALEKAPAEKREVGVSDITQPVAEEKKKRGRPKKVPPEVRP
jgi:hypothetical protein